MATDWQDEPESLIYANWTRVGSTPFELSIDVGYSDAPFPPRAYPARVLMSWEQAKSLRGLLDEAITVFETEVGPIRDLGMEIGPARPLGPPSDLSSGETE